MQRRAHGRAPGPGPADLEERAAGGLVERAHADHVQDPAQRRRSAVVARHRDRQPAHRLGPAGERGGDAGADRGVALLVVDRAPGQRDQLGGRARLLQHAGEVEERARRPQLGLGAAVPGRGGGRALGAVSAPMLASASGSGRRVSAARGARRRAGITSCCPRRATPGVGRQRRAGVRRRRARRRWCRPGVGRGGGVDDRPGVGRRRGVGDRPPGVLDRPAAVPVGARVDRVAVDRARRRHRGGGDDGRAGAEAGAEHDDGAKQA